MVFICVFVLSLSFFVAMLVPVMCLCALGQVLKMWADREAIYQKPLSFWALTKCHAPRILKGGA